MTNRSVHLDSESQAGSERNIPHLRKRRKELHQVGERQIAIPTTLTSLETRILEIAATWEKGTTRQFYAYEILPDLKESLKPASPTNGAVYKACNRLEGWTMLTSQREAVAETLARGGVVSRKIYSVTTFGLSRLLAQPGTPTKS